VSQRRQSPGSANFDSVETDYDSLGRPSRVTVPYAGTAGQMNGSVPATTTSYDALSRVTQTTDGGGGTVMLSFSQNDVLSTVGPAPQNENSKRRQLEYDSLGRLTSVCEVTTATGSGTCGQSSSATGYWTKYTYDALNNLIVVTQNAQSSGSTQTRNYSYDDLSRLTSETNPETGTTTYTYDSDSTCGSTSSGDLVKRIDAVGNTTCYFYDALHRVTSTTYSGSYASRTPAKCYVYDGATVNSQTMANAKGRLAEAYTAASCPNGTKTTDIGMSYSARGEVTDVWESTPHSGGYYHANASYWANGALNTLSGLGLPTLTYSADGEGRPSSVSASSGTNPVTSTAYNVSSQPTGLTFGTSDSDGFSFDGNSGRMKQYTFTVGASPNTVTGQLTWNANGTLQQLAITDQFNSANTQTCNYSYDDLVRIAGVNCGSVWSQTFGFDPFGNLTKSGSVSFQPTYNTSTNRMQSLPGFTPTYDANGNTTADSLHTYAWDVDGNSTTIDSLTVTYDALDRMVEQASGSTYTESAYGPAGTKLALMNGQSLVKAFVPLPAGAVAVYGSGGTLSYFRHPDWLGSSRFSSTTSRTMYYSRAYAPFGETYAESGTQERAFAGMNQDTVQSSTSGLYDALFREYEQYGRWVSPDPAGLAAVDPTNPQTWNRYAYVANNPLSGVDPLGLCGDGVTWDCPMIDEKDGTWGTGLPGWVPGWVPGGQEWFLGGLCPLDGVPTSCSLVGAMLQSGAAYPSSLGGQPCYQAPSGSLFCGSNEANRVAYDPSMLDPSAGWFGFFTTFPSSNNGTCGITVKCRGIQTDNLGKIGMQHCDAQVTDSSGQLWSLSGGPQPNYMSITALNAWATSPPTEPFTGTTVYQGNSCSAAGCMIQSTQAWNQDIVKPAYSPVFGPNSNTWLKGTAAGCGVSLPINAWGSIW